MDNISATASTSRCLKLEERFELFFGSSSPVNNEDIAVPEPSSRKREKKRRKRSSISLKEQPKTSDDKNLTVEAVNNEQKTVGAEKCVDAETCEPKAKRKRKSDKVKNTFSHKYVDENGNIKRPPTPRFSIDSDDEDSSGRRKPFDKLFHDAEKDLCVALIDRKFDEVYATLKPEISENKAELLGSESDDESKNSSEQSTTTSDSDIAGKEAKDEQRGSVQQEEIKRKTALPMKLKLIGIRHFGVQADLSEERDYVFGEHTKKLFISRKINNPVFVDNGCQTDNIKTSEEIEQYNADTSSSSTPRSKQSMTVTADLTTSSAEQLPRGPKRRIAHKSSLDILALRPTVNQPSTETNVQPTKCNKDKEKSVAVKTSAKSTSATEMRSRVMKQHKKSKLELLKTAFRNAYRH